VEKSGKGDNINWDLAYKLVNEIQDIVIPTYLKDLKLNESQSAEVSRNIDYLFQHWKNRGRFIISLPRDFGRDLLKAKGDRPWPTFLKLAIAALDAR
jgi:hypothetical protein